MRMPLRWRISKVALCLARVARVMGQTWPNTCREAKRKTYINTQTHADTHTNTQTYTHTSQFLTGIWNLSSLAFSFQMNVERERHKRCFAEAVSNSCLILWQTTIFSGRTHANTSGKVILVTIYTVHGQMQLKLKNNGSSSKKLKYNKR